MGLGRIGSKRDRIRLQNHGSIESSASRPSWIQREPRLAVFGWVIVMVLGLYIIRIWQLQFLEGGAWLTRAEEQQTKLVSISPPRGVIFDRNGEILVRNIATYNVVIIPGELPEDPEHERAVLIQLSQLIDIPYSSKIGLDIPEYQGELNIAGRATYPPYGEAPDPGLLERVDATRYVEPYKPIVVKLNVERDLALLISQEGGMTMPGVDVQSIPRRRYPYAELSAQVLGYLLPIAPEFVEEYEAKGYDPSVDRIGSNGIEAQYEENLRGTSGSRVIEKDVMGKELGVQSETQEQAGDNLYLTLDIELQAIAEQALQEKGLAESGSRRGVVIALDPRDGQVLAMVSLPTYDNNIFSKRLDLDEYMKLIENPHKPLINHAIYDKVAPGSIYKIVPATAALQEGLINRYSTVNCPGRMLLPNKFAPDDPSLAQPFYCWIYLQSGGGHGPVNVVDALAQSCDVFFYQVGGGYSEGTVDIDGLGVDRLAAYSRMFGLGSPTGIDLPAESDGLVPTPEWKRRIKQETWTTGNTYIFAIGQGDLLATPLQMANALAVVANGGTLYQPQIVHHTTDADGNVITPFKPIISNTLDIDETVWQIVREGLDLAVSETGTGNRALLTDLNINVAGKTGTAEYCDDIALKAGRCDIAPGETLPTHAWFMAYAPTEAPEIVVLVWVYDGGEGSVIAAPVAHDVLDFYFRRNLGLLEEDLVTDGEPTEVPLDTPAEITP